MADKKFEKSAPEKNKRRWIFRTIRSAFVIYVLVTVFVVIAEPWLMFPGIMRTSEEIDLFDPSLTTVSIPTGDEQQIQGLLYEPENPRGLVIICHGNGDLLCFMEDEVRQMSRNFDVAVLAFDYRGFGNSDGFPTATRLIEDGQAAYDFAIEKGYSARKIVVYGRSLGGAIATSIAANNEIAGLGLRSTFSSITGVAAAKFPWLPVRWLLRNRFPSAERIADYHGPLVQRHGDADRIVPIRFGRELFEAATNASSKVFIEEKGLGHNQPPTRKFWNAFGKMLDECLAD